MFLIAAPGCFFELFDGVAARLRGFDRAYRATSVGSRPKRTRSDFAFGVFCIDKIRWGFTSLLDEVAPVPEYPFWG